MDLVLNPHYEDCAQQISLLKLMGAFLRWGYKNVVLSTNFAFEMVVSSDLNSE